MHDPEDIGDLAKDVGRRLRRYRSVVKMTQDEFGDKAGIAQARYSNYESGVRLLTLAAALSLCKHYSITLDWIYHGDPSGLPIWVHDKLKAARKKDEG